MEKLKETLLETELTRHVAECTMLRLQTERRLADLEQALRSNTRITVSTLLAACGTLFVFLIELLARALIK